MRRLWRFSGGVKLDGHKAMSNHDNIENVPLPPKLYVPIRQHVGEPADVLVEIGDKVKKGQLIAECNGFVSSSVHAPSSGTVTNITQHPYPHAANITETTVVIDTDGLDSWHPNVTASPKPLGLTANELRQRIRNAGIVGLGGAVFPSAVKLKPTRPIDTLIINGVECEPYITCDDVIMRQYCESIVQGIFVLAHIIKPQKIILAIEDNKKIAFDRMCACLERFKQAGTATSSLIDIVMVPTIFPTGGEKQLIKVLTGKEVSPGRLPFDLGMVCLNVATTVAVYNAIYKGQPLISRIMTVTGDGVERPGNYHVLLGTPISHVLDHAGAMDARETDIVMGGPMMGVHLSNLDAPVVKATNCLLTKKVSQENKPMVMPCIRCGQCATACPMNLLPQMLYFHARAKSLAQLDNYHLKDCIECGCCNYVCPSNIPLVEYFKFAKSELRAKEKERKLADVARLRNELRQQRIERNKKLAEERKAKRKAARKRTKKAAPPATPSPEPNAIDGPLEKTGTEQ